MGKGKSPSEGIRQTSCMAAGMFYVATSERGTLVGPPPPPRESSAALDVAIFGEEYERTVRAGALHCPAVPANGDCRVQGLAFCFGGPYKP